jgi:hypothetical protein
MGFFNIPPPSGGGQGGSTPTAGTSTAREGATPGVNIPVARKLGPKSLTAGGYAPYNKIALSALTAAKSIKTKYYR